MKQKYKKDIGSIYHHVFDQYTIYYGSTKPDLYQQEFEDSLILEDREGDLVDIFIEMKKNPNKIPFFAWGSE
ncbi:MAG: hypothetical protein QW273_02040 [Candidatus Pacearchaeota archaeon]